MTIYTSTEGQSALPRYFAAVFSKARGLRHGRLDMVLPDGRRFRAQGQAPGPVAEIHVHDADVFTRLIREGDLGFCEAYMDGAWSTPDLQAFMDLVHADNDQIYDGFLGMGLIRAFERARFWLQSNTKRGSRKNIAYHYDLGNAFYDLWLDDSMTYSSALFSTGQESTEAAQRAKYASMIEQMGARPGEHVLEIGCGWGGFAEYAAGTHGLRVTGLTISREQRDYAVERIKRAGLSDQVEIVLRDYRDEKGTYDHIASIEMFEAVGQKYWPVYFKAVQDRLRPGGRATFQIITVQDKRWDVYRKGVDFVQKHIFPGGMLPSPRVLRAEIEAAGLRVARSIEFGDSYDQTLRRWHQTFNERWEDIASMGFDARFQRMWNLYLTSCAASFRSGNCDLTQITVTHPT